MIRALALCIASIWGAAVQAQECNVAEHDGNKYTVCRINMADADLRLFLNDPSGALLGQFSAINRMLAPQGQTLSFAMNAGMYHTDRAPVGLYRENGAEVMRLVPGAGPGNFGLVPNGVFCIRHGRADVIETEQFQVTDPTCTYATQSGPMLVIDGQLHPRFLADGTSKFIRNGVGTSSDGQTVVFAISDNAVNFHSFGRFFRDHLQLPNALYFDGKVSRIYAPDLNRNDIGFALGPIVGLVSTME